MSEKISLENKSEKVTEKKQKKENEKEEKINPLSLLSKDLLDEINSLEEIDLGEKKDSITTQKESELNEEDDYILEVDEETEKDIFGYEIFKNEENDKPSESKKIQLDNYNTKQGRFSQPMPNQKKSMNFNSSQIEDPNFYFSIGRLSYDYPQYQNTNDSFNIQFNNPIQNNLNFFNNSFTMNGKSGWVCAFCKNFNYESKYSTI
jgi:hypothetical protein